MPERAAAARHAGWREGGRGRRSAGDRRGDRGFLVARHPGSRSRSGPPRGRQAPRPRGVHDHGQRHERTPPPAAIFAGAGDPPASSRWTDAAVMDPIQRASRTSGRVRSLGRRLNPTRRPMDARARSTTKAPGRRDERDEQPGHEPPEAATADQPAEQVEVQDLDDAQDADVRQPDPQQGRAPARPGSLARRPTRGTSPRR